MAQEVPILRFAFPVSITWILLPSYCCACWCRRCSMLSFYAALWPTVATPWNVTIPMRTTCQALPRRMIQIRIRNKGWNQRMRSQFVWRVARFTTSQTACMFWLETKQVTRKHLAPARLAFSCSVWNSIEGCGLGWQVTQDLSCACEKGPARSTQGALLLLRCFFPTMAVWTLGDPVTSTNHLPYLVVQM